ncbi:MAG: chromate resistance protein [Burkholderiales bacterium]|nr:chromate resistance protein [Burkholderiales bacterium]
MFWHLLVLSLPTENATARMRAWRALKACGAAVLRDGVYLLPEGEDHRVALATIADDLRANGGTAHLLGTDAARADFEPLFDRSAEFGALLAEITERRAALTEANAFDAIKAARKLRKNFEQLATIDFFAGEAQRQAREALQELEAEAQRTFAPDEPHAAAHGIQLLNLADYRNRVWATRRRPWVDRLASAWLIRRFIDPQARFVWLKTPADCPKKAIGFDFDGATFSHLGARVTFETLLASFALESPALLRLGTLVHGLDAGGVRPVEADGVERVLAGLLEAIPDDDQLLLVAGGVFEGLFTAFQKETTL